MTITVSKEAFSDFIEEALPLVTEHWKEVSANRDKVPLSVDREKYLALEAAGKLFCFVARDNGELIGYNVFFVDTHIHYKETVFAANDAIFVKPEYRGRPSLSLISFAEESLKKEGVSVIHYHMKIWKEFKKLMELFEYQETEIIYGKYIGD